MLVSVEASELFGALSVAARAADRRSSVSVLRAVRLYAFVDSLGSGRLAVSCTDCAQAVTVTVAALVESVAPCKPGDPSGVVVASGVHELAALVKTMSGTVELTVSTGDAPMLSVAGTGAAFGVPATPAEDWPADFTTKLTVGAVPYSVLAQCFSGVADAYSSDHSRPMLTGVLVELDGETVRMVATDSYRLHVETVTGAAAGFVGGSFVVPGATLAQLVRAAKPRKGDGDRLVTFARGDSHVTATVQDAGLMVGARLLDGQYPSWRQLRPDRFEADLRPDRVGLLASLDRVGKVAKTARGGHSSPARFELEPVPSDTFGLSVHVQDGAETAETVAGTWDGEPMTIGFRPSFIADAVASLPAGETVHVRMINPLRPALVEGDRADCWRLVMPIRLAA